MNNNNGLNGSLLLEVQPEEELISKTEAAALLKISSRTLERYQEQGRVQPRYVNEDGKNKVKYSLQEICDFGSILLASTTPPTSDGAAVEGAIQVVDESTGIQSLTQSIVEAIASTVPVLSRYQELDNAVENKWLLTTKDVANLVGSVPKQKGGVYAWGGYNFVVEGKIGNGYGWRVEKIA